MVRRLTQLALLVLVAPGVVLLGPVVSARAAGATSVKPVALQSAWFWKTAYEQVSPPVAPPAAPPTEPSGVPAGDLAVAMTSNDGSPSKMSVVSFNLGAIKPGDTIEAFTVALTVDSSGVGIGSGAAPIVACLPTRLWSPAEGGDYTNEPPVDCSQKVAPKVHGDVYSFAIPALAQQWVDDENLGVAFVPAPGTTQPFQVVFKGAKTITAAARFLAGAAAPVVDKQGSTGTGATTEAGQTTRAGAAGPAATAAAAPPAVPAVVPPAGPTTALGNDAAPPPQVADPQAAPIAATPAARALPAAPSSPSGAFWLAAIGIALLLLTAAVVLGDSKVPVPTATSTRLSRVLRERELEKARANELAATLSLRSA